MVELADVGPFPPGVHTEAFGRFGDGSADELFEQRSDRERAVRADFGNGMEGPLVTVSSAHHGK